MPQALQALTRANPLRYAIDLAERVYLEGAGLRLLLPDLLPLALIALITLTSAAWLFRRGVA
jgi:ABC-2 type transport system permease protein